jgi:hypothetical protein
MADPDKDRFCINNTTTVDVHKDRISNGSRRVSDTMPAGPDQFQLNGFHLSDLERGDLERDFPIYVSKSGIVRDLCKAIYDQEHIPEVGRTEIWKVHYERAS